MAFLATQTSTGENGSFLPILKYDSRAGRLFMVDRTQGADGWSSNQTDITMTQPQMAFDFGSLEVGYSYFAQGMAPMWHVVPYGQPMPARPASPGNDEKGKPLNFKSGFRMKVGGKAIGGVRELGGNANAFIAGLNELHTKFEAAPEAHAGKIPVAKMVNTIPIKSGQSTNYQPVFEIVQWVDRGDIFGARTVPPPGAAPAKATEHQSNHVPPPVLKAPTPPASPPATDMAAAMEDAIPF